MVANLNYSHGYANLFLYNVTKIGQNHAIIDKTPVLANQTPSLANERKR